MRHLTLILLCLPLVLAPSAAAFDLLPGDVVVLDQVNDSVVRVRPADYDAGDPTANQTVITQGGFFEVPYDVAIGDGELFVTDSSADIIVRVALSDGSQSVVGGGVGVNVGGSPLLGFDPRGIAIDSRGMLVVGDTGLDKILEVNPATGGAADFTPSIFLAGPSYVLVDPTDRFYILDGGLLVRITPMGQIAETVGSSTSRGLARDPQSGNVYVAGASDIFRYDPEAYDPQNTAANRTVVFDDDGSDVGVLPGGDLVATNSGGSHLLRIDPVTMIGTRIAHGGNLVLPTGLAVMAPEPGSMASELTAFVAVAILSAHRVRRRSHRAALRRARSARVA